MTVIDTHVTGFVDSIGMFKTARIVMRTRGWLGHVRHYTSTIVVTYLEIATAASLGALVRVKTEAARQSLADLVAYEYTSPRGRWDAAHRDWGEMDAARWRLLDRLARSGPQRAAESAGGW